jgi:CDP-6-deoxy-D-xylo-4-hexulose-3-dehydrase
MSKPKSLQGLTDEIERLVREYSGRVHGGSAPASSHSIPFIPGETPIPYAGRVFTGDEVAAAVRATLDF